MTNNFTASPEIYPPEKKEANKKTIWEYYFARKIAFFVAPLFIKLGISPNQISFFSLMSGIAGTLFIALGDFYQIIFGFFLMQAWLVLDKTDGVVARITGKVSKFGEFFEEINGSLISGLFFASIGFASYRFPGVLISHYFPDSKVMIAFGLATSVFVFFRHLAARHFEAVFGPGKSGNLGVGQKGFWGGIYTFTVKLSGVYSLAQPILILAAVFHFMGVYTFFYFATQGLLMTINIIYLIFKARGK